jgi:hypothetical protein
VSAYGLKSWLAMCPGQNKHPPLLLPMRDVVYRTSRVFGEQHVDYVRAGGLVLLRPSSVLLLSRLVRRMRSVRRSFRIHAISRAMTMLTEYSGR